MLKHNRNYFIVLALFLTTILISGCGSGEDITRNLEGKISFTVDWPKIDIYNTPSKDKLISPELKYVKIDIYDSNNNIVFSRWIQRNGNSISMETFILPVGTYTIDVGGYKDDKTTLISHRRTFVIVRPGETSDLTANLGVSIMINNNGLPGFVPPNPSIRVGDEITFVNNTGTPYRIKIGDTVVTVGPYDPNNPGVSSYTYRVPNVYSITFQLYDEAGNPIGGTGGSNNVGGYSGGGGGGGGGYIPPVPTATPTATWVDISGNLPSGGGTASLSDLYFVDPNEGWICSGAAGEIYHTADGGETFTTQTTQYYTNSIHMIDANEGYAGGYDGKVYRTTDSGITWKGNGSIGGTLLSISFPPSSTTGYCSGYTGRIYSITSSEVSAMNSGVTTNLRSISFPSSGLGWTCGDGVIINYNGSWSQQDPPSEGYNSIYMVNNTTGWAVGSSGVIVNTTDGGLSWNYQSNPDTSTRALNDVFFLNANEGWAVGNSGVILHTTNGGTAWSIEGSGLTTNMLRTVQFTSSSNGYVLGNNKTLLKFKKTI